MNEITAFTALTMSSREIATLTGKRHDNVMADCRKLAEFYADVYSPEISGEWVASTFYQDSTGRLLPCFNLCKQASLDLVTGYSLPHRHAVNKRWQELEEAATKPKELTREEILVMALESERERIRLAAELEAAQPAIQLQEEITKANDEYTTRDLCKLLFNGAVKERDLRAWFINNKWCNKDGQPSAWAMARGLMRSRMDEIKALKRFVPVAVCTGKGLVTLRHLYRTNELFVSTVSRLQLLPPGKS